MSKQDKSQQANQQDNSNQQSNPPPLPTQYYQHPPTPQFIEVVHRQKANPVLMVFYAIFWPFAKIFELVRYAIKIILEEMLRGVIRFIFGLIFLALFFLMLAVFFVYIVAFVQVGFSFNDAFPRAIEIISGLLPF